MPASLLVALILVPVFIATGLWFAHEGRQTVAFKVIKLLHTAFVIVVGMTLIALSVSSAAQPDYAYWVQWFLTNMFVQLYLCTAVPFMLGFAWVGTKATPQTPI